MIVISATIDYNGSTIATVTNETKILTTGGKWVAGNIKITDVNEAPNVTQDQEGYVVLDDGGTPQTIVNPLSITSNGTYSASSGYAFNPVVVDIGGGITVDDIAEGKIVGAISGDANFIRQYAFQSCSSLTAASFPSCISIGNSAFDACYSLISISFPICTSIGNFTFQSCSSLTVASFSVCTYVGNDAFKYCTSLTTVNFPICNTIKGNTFQYCSSLTSISFPSCISIGNNAFQSCTSLTTANFPVCTSIGSGAFNGCFSLASISFPVCTYIASSAFQACTSLTTVSFPVCSFVGIYAFYGCHSLDTVSLSVCTYIGASAFAYCSSLTTICLPACSVISTYAFIYCTSLRTAIFNNSSATQGIIYNYAFRYCYNLLSLYLLASTLYRLSISSTTFASTPISDYTTSTGGIYGSIYVPQSLYNSYISSTNWSYYSSRFVSLTESQVSYVMEHGTHIMS